GQSVDIATAAPTPLSVRVNDADGDPLSGIAVTFTAPASGASGNFASSGITSIASVGATVLTDANGVATAPAFTANGTTGSYVVQATVSGLLSKIVNFAMTNTDPPPPTTTTTTTPTTTTSAAVAPTTAPPPTTAAPRTSTPIGAHPHVGRIVPRGSLIRTGSDSTTALALSGAALFGLGGGALAFAARRRRQIAERA
ncbi:MAG: LPXTG cell wall anchor domain-containing protein, partial [Acidimicrobiia bacterium]